MSLKARLLGSNLTVILLVVLLVGILYQRITTMIETESWVEHTHEVMEQGFLLEKLMLDMETGERGFLITGTDEFLEPYHAALDTYSETMAKSKSLVSDNPEQVARLSRIEELSAHWLEIAAIPEISERRKIEEHQIDSEYLQIVLLKGVGKGILDNFRMIAMELDSKLSQSGDERARYLVLAIQKDMLDSETGQRGFLLTGEESFLDPFTSGQRLFVTHLAELSQIVDSRNDRDSLGRDIRLMSDLAERWLKEAAEPEIAARREMNTSKSSIKIVSAMIQEGEGKRMMDSFRSELADFINAEKNLLEVRTSASQRSASDSLSIAAFGTLATVIFGVVAMIFVIRGILRQVGGEPARIADIAEQVAQGHLDIEIRNGHDGTTGILSSIATMVENLRTQIAEIRDGVTLLGSTSREMGISVTQLSGTAIDAASAVGETTTTLEEVRRTSELARDRASEVSEAAQRSVEVSRLGQVATHETVKSIQGIQEQVESVANSIVKLSEQSQAISEIITVVDDLAEQSNLLAVNAAIEAAKAGEQGKGFSVVADEVRSLAVQSKEATGQVRTILSEVQSATSAAVMATEQAGKAVDVTTAQSTKGGEAIRTLGETIDSASEAASQIAVSSQQQFAGVEQVTKAMESIKQISQENVASTQQLEEAAKGINGMGIRLEELVDRYTL